MLTHIHKHTDGFTIIELLVVIIIIAILIGLVITTHSGIQSQSRNATRRQDLDHIAPEIEGFYSDKGYYPSEADLSSTAWDTSHLPNLPLSYLHDPSAKTSGITISNTPLKIGTYQYIAKDIGGSAANCEAKDSTCANFTLTAPLEGGGTYVKSNID